MNALRYAPRRVIAGDPLHVRGRTLKTYAMYAESDAAVTAPETAWLEKQVSTLLDEPSRPEDHALGFLILHVGAEGIYLLVSQWYDADMLRHQVRGAPLGPLEEATFAPLEQHDLLACVWELGVLAFERDAWINTVMAWGSLDRPAVDAYLATTFSGWV